MPLDAILLSALKTELESSIIGAKIDRVFQPEKDEILLHLRTARDSRGGQPRESLRLLFSASPNHARVHLSEHQKDNPQVPPMFCMLLRKHLVGGVINSLSQPQLERLLEFDIGVTDEMGERSNKRLVIELIGRQSNLILLDSEGRIIDSLRRVDSDLSSARQVLPGMFYRPPLAPAKHNLYKLSDDDVINLIRGIPRDGPLDKWILDTFFGISPLIAREISALSGGSASCRYSELDEAGRSKFADSLIKLFSIIREGGQRPFLLADGKVPYDISYIPISQYGRKYSLEEMASFSTLVETFYFKKDLSVRIRQRTQEMSKSISSTLARVRRKVEQQKLEFETARDRERLREYGDIIMANLHKIPRGSARVQLQDFYSPDGADVAIDIDIRLTPQQNAARYYKNYNRMKNAEKILAGQIESGEIEIKYLESVMDLIKRALSDRDIQDIREELQNTGYLRRESKNARKKQKEQPPREYMSQTGFSILVGRNNIQNDWLTFKEARRNDIWFHVRGFHGSHVVIRCGDTEPDDDTYTQAATIAAYYSEARDGSNVPVDYTRIRHVKKIPGAKPGMVTYDPYFTAYVKQATI